MSSISASGQVTSGLPPASTAAVAWSYVGYVLLPLVAAPIVGQALVWVAENPLGSRGQGTGVFVVSVLMGWCLACTGTVVLARRLRDDRASGCSNGARGWHRVAVGLLIAVWVPVVLVVLVALGLAIGFSNWRS